MLFCDACPDHLSCKSSKASDYSFNLVCDRHNRICAINLTRQCYSSRTKWSSPRMSISAASDVTGRCNARRWIACKAEGEKQAKHKRVKFKDGREFSPIINVRSRLPRFWIDTFLLSKHLEVDLGAQMGLNLISLRTDLRLNSNSGANV